jgi:hypothetical protein
LLKIPLNQLKKKALTLNKVAGKITSRDTGRHAGMVPTKFVDLQP